MPTYGEWRTSDQANLLLQLCRLSGASFPSDAGYEALDIQTDAWEIVCCDRFTRSWKSYLPEMDALCTLGYFLVQAGVLSHGNANAALEYVLRLLTSIDAGSLHRADHERWIARFEAIQAAVDAAD
jgi:hypothetical protein